MYKNIFKYDEMKRAEHMAVRTCVGWYFWTHQILEITGPDVTAFLEYMYPNKIGNLAVGRDRYTTMLDEQGEIIDDVVIMRMAEDKYWVSTLFASKTDDWWYYHQGDYDVDWTEVTDDWAMYAVQGPKSKEVMESLVKDSVADLKFFAHMDTEIDGIACKINRGGFTGEKLGYEIYVDKEDGEALEAVLAPAVTKAGGREVTEFQVMAWTLPTEANFYYMRDLAHTNPFEVGLAGGIDWEKDFIGKAALLKVKEEGPAREMVGFEVPEADIYIRSKQYGGPGEPVFIDGEEEEVGRVSKLVYSYVKEVNNGYILAKKDKLHVGDKIKIHGYDAVITEKNWL
ncbi:MAG: aminomethyl transferase family protein [Lachnospiraceae bacterium]|nr:aminomethyl transferase family protein [Lachnospiraceae bacterium]